MHATAEAAETVANAERFRNEAGLAKLAADWPMTRLVEIWNSLPGVTQVSKFKDRTTAIGRIWKAIQDFGFTESEVPAESGELAPVATAAQTGTAAEQLNETLAATAPDASTTDVAPQSGHVAPEAPAASNEATPAAGGPTKPSIDKVEADRLLKIAADTQTAYWTALRDLEKVIGFEIDDPGDLRDATLDELMGRRKLVHRPKTRRAAAVDTGAPRENSKTNQVIAMLKRPEGTTLEEIMTAMGWQKGMAETHPARHVERRGRLSKNTGWWSPARWSVRMSATSLRDDPA